MSEKTYLKRNTKLTNYVILPRPKEISGISNTAKLVYALILARGTLSQKNDKWIEADDRVTLVYTEKSIAEELNCKERTVINAINELKKENLLEVKEDSKGRANVYYLLLPKSSVVSNDTCKNLQTTYEKNDSHKGVSVKIIADD